MSRLVDLASIPPFEVWGEEIVARKIEGDRITMSVVELAPGSTLPIHQHAQEQLGICLDGEMTFTIGDETRTIGPGGTWCIPSDVPHGARIGPQGAIALDAFSPRSATTGRSRCWSLSRRSGPVPTTATDRIAHGGPDRRESQCRQGGRIAALRELDERRRQADEERPEPRVDARRCPAATPAPMTSRPAVMPVSSQPGLASIQAMASPPMAATTRAMLSRERQAAGTDPSMARTIRRRPTNRCQRGTTKERRPGHPPRLEPRARAIDAVVLTLRNDPTRTTEVGTWTASSSAA